MIELHLGGCKQNNQTRRFIMNLTQNDGLKQVTFDTLIVGVDVGSKTHFCRAFDWRGLKSPTGCLSLAIRGWDFLLSLDGLKNS